MDQKYLQELFAKIDDSHKEFNSKLNNIDKTLVKQHEQLKYHIKRTDLLEQRVQEIKDEVVPIHTHVDRVQFFFKVVKWIGLPLILTSMGYLLKAYLGV